MKLLQSVLLILMALAAPAPQDMPASIQGTVRDSITNNPVGGAMLELSGIVGNKVVSQITSTAPDGTFSFSGIPPGSGYELVAQESGNYRITAYGQHGPSDPWNPIALKPGQQLTDLRMFLVPITIIAGHVADGKGKPIVNATVQALQPVYTADGSRILQAAGAAVRTTANGDYYLPQLPASQYYIQVTRIPLNDSAYDALFFSPALWDRLNGAKKKTANPAGYPTVYYPGTSDVANAQPVNLRSGGRKTGVDITVEKIQTHRVSGTVVNDTTGLPAHPLKVVLVPRDAGMKSDLTRLADSADGHFDIYGVFPGSYYLYAYLSDANLPLSTRSLVEVRDTDQINTSIRVNHGVDVPGKIRFEDWPDAGRPPDFSQLVVSIEPATRAPVDDTIASTEFKTSAAAVVPTPAGTFTFHNVPTGDYHVRVFLNAKLPASVQIPLDLRDAYMKSATLGAVDVLDIRTNGLHIDSTPAADLEISIATNSGSLAGRVMDENHEPVPSIRTVLIPDAAFRQRPDRYRASGTSTTGRFSVEGIPPGDYKVFAWNHVDDGAWMDPEFIKLYEDRGTPIHIEEWGAQYLEIPLIR